MKTFVLMIFITQQHLLVPGYATKADCEAAGKLVVKYDVQGSAGYFCFPGPPSTAQR